MQRVFYISQSYIVNDRDTLAAIVQASSLRNAAVGITGMLWSGPNEFVQVLEGEHDAVGDTMKRIAADRRHGDIEIICDRTVRSRMFGSWAMVRSDTSAACTSSTAYLVGYAGGQNSPAARRLVDLILSTEL